MSDSKPVLRDRLFGTLFIVIGLALACLGLKAADPSAPLLVLPSQASESARWIATQLWGLSMASFLSAGGAVLLGQLSPATRSAIVTVGMASSLLLARS